MALALEILSSLEAEKTCLGVVAEAQSATAPILSFLSSIPSISSTATQTEFEEYELQYLYPLSGDAVHSVEQHIAGSPSVDEMVRFVAELKAESKCFSNFETTRLLMTYALRTFYFAESSAIDDEAFALSLIYSSDRTERTAMSHLLRMLSYSEPAEDEEDDEMDDEEDAVSSHSLLLLSTAVTVWGQIVCDDNGRGLVPLLDALERDGVVKYQALRAFVQNEDDRQTQRRREALSKMADWYQALDAKMVRLAMAADDDDDDDEDDGADANGYGGNLLAQRKHKTAADYEQISLWSDTLSFYDHHHHHLFVRCTLLILARCACGAQMWRCGVL